MSEFLTVHEAAYRAGRTVDQVRYLLRRGEIDGAEHLGRTWAIPASAIDIIRAKAILLAK